MGFNMNINTIWKTAKADADFIKDVKQAIHFSDIQWEDWLLLDISYMGNIYEVDVFADSETDVYFVYPTFYSQTLTELDPLKIHKNEVLNG